MSDAVLITIIICSTVLLSVATLGMFVNSSNESTADKLVAAWKAIALARAEHERVCPRLTDKPRGQS